MTWDTTHDEEKVPTKFGSELAPKEPHRLVTCYRMFRVIKAAMEGIELSCTPIRQSG